MADCVGGVYLQDQVRALNAIVRRTDQMSGTTYYVKVLDYLFETDSKGLDVISSFILENKEAILARLKEHGCKVKKDEK